MHREDPKKGIPEPKYLGHIMMIVALLLSYFDFPLNFLWWGYALYVVYAIGRRLVGMASNADVMLRAGIGLLVMLILSFDVPPQYYLALVLGIVLHWVFQHTEFFQNHWERKKPERKPKEEEEQPEPDVAHMPR